MEFTRKEKYSIDDLISIVTILRSPGGCPWDREQTHESIRKNLLEESYEAAEAIDSGDASLLCEELGDVLLQVVLHAEIEREKAVFDFSDIADGVSKKLILRHPHVFGDVQAHTSEEVLKNWDEIKKKSKGQNKQSETMKSVSKALPALMRSQKIQQKAAKVGFDWADIIGAAGKLHEEINELDEAINQGILENISEELGDVLFSAVNIARFAKLDAEEVLESANSKFIKRFEALEELAISRSIDIEKAPLEVLDKLWDEIKLR